MAHITRPVAFKDFAVFQTLDITHAVAVYHGSREDCMLAERILEDTSDSATIPRKLFTDFINDSVRSGRLSSDTTQYLTELLVEYEKQTKGGLHHV